MPLSDIHDMPWSDEVWLLLVRKARGFLEDEGKQHRPYLVLLYTIAPTTDLLEKDFIVDNLGEFPKTSHILEMIEKEIKNKERRNPPRKPKSVIFTSPRLYKEMLKPLQEYHGVPIKLWTEEENQGFGDDHVADFSDRMRKKQQLGYCSANLKPGLATAVSKDRAKTFFSAAAAFFKTKPWAHFKSKEVFTVAVPGHGARLCFLASESAEGQGNMLGMETNTAELLHLLKNGERLTLDDSEGAYHRCLTFTNEFGMPFEDLVAFDLGQYELGGSPDVALPFPFCFKRDTDEGLMRPNKRELEWFEIVMRALTLFNRDWAAKSEELAPPKCHDLVYQFQEGPLDAKITAHVGYWGYDFDGVQKAWPDIEKVAAVPVGSAEPKPVVANVTADLDVCVMCGKKENIVEGLTLKRCGACKLKMYCSRECQAKHWNLHKTQCKKPA